MAMNGDGILIFDQKKKQFQITIMFEGGAQVERFKDARNLFEAMGYVRDVIKEMPDNLIPIATLIFEVGK